MLFSPPKSDSYKLWSAPRCLVWLGFGILVFVLSVGISLALIQIRPSAEIDLKEYSATYQYKLKEPGSLDAHNLESAICVRIIYQDSSIAEWGLQDTALKINLTDQKEKRAVFLICAPRSVWSFLWQRLSFRLGIS